MNIFYFGCFIAFAILLWYFSSVTYKNERITRINQWFGSIVLVRREESYWKRYLRKILKDATRAGVPFDLEKWEKRIPLIAAGALVVFLIAGIPWWLGATLTILLGLLPQQIIKEVGNRRVITFRKDLLREAIPIGIHALSKASLEKACLEIIQTATSPLIKREFKLVYDLGNAPSMTVSEAMILRAEQLGLREYFTLAVATYEGERRQANLREIWRDTEQVLFREVSMQNQISAETSTYRLVAILLFFIINLAILVGYKALHIKGILSLGIWITAISYFVGIIQVSKATDVD